MKIKFLFTILASLSISVAISQVAGKRSYAFLNLPVSARQVALGSNFIATVDNDISQSWQSAAALNSKMHNHAFASYNNYLGDIKGGYFAYVRHWDKLGTFALNVLYMDYGQFEGYTPSGISTGTFTVKDQCFGLAYGKQWKDKFRIGATAKYAYSIYESYVSNALSTDLSAMYIDTAEQLNITAFARNIGFQAIPYGETKRQNLPFELAVTISKRLAHLPFRYHLTFNNLQQPDMRYTINETGEKDENGDVKSKKMTMGDNIVRHISLGGEMNFSKNFVVRFGYNHQKRKEMTQDQRRATTGFSWGLGLKVKKFNISYGSASYFPGFNSNQFSLLLNLSEFYTKK
ncbi:MAG: type IX secretion system protein PorQ [Bacteroidia bacterium]|nr:type IX secretion system protein PorQ [Bacteroidia bacterium]